jgi:hypothetical protein
LRTDKTKKARIVRSSPFSYSPPRDFKRRRVSQQYAALAARQEFWSFFSDALSRAVRLMAMRAGATTAVRLMTLDGAPVLAFERTGALIAKNAADTIRKVWIFLVFMRTPFLTALLS